MCLSLFIYLTAFTFGIVTVVSTGCSFPARAVDSRTNELNRINHVVNTENDLGKELPDTDLENEIKEMIQVYSRELRLPSLIETARRNEFELRLWINAGMPTDEKLLIVRVAKDSNHAHFYHLGEMQHGRVKFRKEVLADPKAGWNALQAEISNRLAIPGRLAADPRFDIARHEGVIALQVVERGQSRFALYGHHTSFEDGIRLINLCESLSGELSVEIDCRGKRTRLGPIR